MESPKIHFSSRCKNRTYLCGTANYPISCKPVLVRERKFAEIRVYLSPCYRISTKEMFISTGSYRYGESKYAFLLSVQTPHLPVCDGKVPRLRLASIGPRTEIWGKPGLFFAKILCLHQSNVDIKRKLQVWRVQKCIPPVSAKTALTCAGRETTQSHVIQYRAKNGNLRKSLSTFRHGTVFAPKQYFYQKEATGIEIPKMHSSSRCKNHTYLSGTANYPVSCKPV